MVMALVLIASVLASATPSAAQQHTGPTIEWDLLEPLPGEVEIGENITIKLEIRNVGDVVLTGGNRTTVELTVKGNTLALETVMLGINNSQPVTFRISFDNKGTHELKLNSYYRYGIVNLYNSQGIKTLNLGSIEVGFPDNPGEMATLHTITNGSVSHKGKQIREEGFIAYKISLLNNHNAEVKVTVGGDSPPVAVLVFASENAFLDYELGVGGTWEGDISNEDQNYKHNITFKADDERDYYIVIDNGYQTGVGSLTGMATVDVSIKDQDYDDPTKWNDDDGDSTPGFGIVIMISAVFLVLIFRLRGRAGAGEGARGVRR